MRIYNMLVQNLQILLPFFISQMSPLHKVKTVLLLLQLYLRSLHVSQPVASYFYLVVLLCVAISALYKVLVATF